MGSRLIWSHYIFPPCPVCLSVCTGPYTRLNLPVSEIKDKKNEIRNNGSDYGIWYLPSLLLLLLYHFIDIENEVSGGKQTEYQKSKWERPIFPRAEESGGLQLVLAACLSWTDWKILNWIKVCRGTYQRIYGVLPSSIPPAQQTTQEEPS